MHNMVMLTEVMMGNDGRMFPTHGLTLEELLVRQRESGGIEAAIHAGDLFKERLLTGEDMLTSDKAASELGIAKETLYRWRKARRVLALKGAKPGYRYPKFQFDSQVFPVMERVLAAMPGYDSWGIYLFLTQREPLLYPDTPLEWLKKGKAEEVLKVARILNEDLA
jgi:hypothetical protein